MNECIFTIASTCYLLMTTPHTQNGFNNSVNFSTCFVSCRSATVSSHSTALKLAADKHDLRLQVRFTISPQKITNFYRIFRLDGLRLSTYVEAKTDNSISWNRKIATVNTTHPLSVICSLCSKLFDIYI